jgi:hypothetical protein
MAVTGVDKDKAKSKSQDDAADLTKQEEKAAPDAEDAIEHATEPDGGLTKDDDEEEIATLSDLPASVLIGSHEVQLAHLAQEAKRDSGLTTKKWNDLDRRERTKLMESTVERLRQEDQEATNEMRAKMATEAAGGEQTDVRVHETRGYGGRYVALGGGERVRIAEASTAPDVIIPDDDELVN